MAYSNETEAVEVLDETSETLSETAEPASGKTFFIPQEYQDDTIANAAPGDVVQIRIVGKNADGAMEAECVAETADEDNWEGSLENAMPESIGGKMKGSI